MSDLNKFVTLPLAGFTALMLFASFAMFTHSELQKNPNHKVWNIMESEEEISCNNGKYSCPRSISEIMKDI